jgi:hypothetical protein
MKLRHTRVYYITYAYIKGMTLSGHSGEKQVRFLERKLQADRNLKDF